MSERLSGLDALRATLILFGLPFHAGLPYAEGAMGLMQSDQTSGAVGAVILLLRTFRMPTFFVVAGFFAALILKRRKPEIWIVDRLKRLLIPLAFGVLVLKLPIDALVRAFRVETGHWIGTPLSTFYHLWFLVTLFLFCLAVYATRPLLERIADALGRRLARLSRPAGEVAFAGLVGLAILWEIGVEALVDTRAVAALPLVGTVHVTLVYAPWFVFGYGVGRVSGGLAWFSRIAPSSLVLGAAFLALDYAVARSPNFEAESVAHLAAWTGAGFYLGRALVMLAVRLPFAGAPAVRRVVDYAMPIYMLHYPWAMIFAVVLVPAHLPGGLQFGLVVGLTAVATVATGALVAKSPTLWFLINGRRAVSPPGGPIGHTTAPA